MYKLCICLKIFIYTSWQSTHRIGAGKSLSCHIIQHHLKTDSIIATLTITIQLLFEDSIKEFTTSCEVIRTRGRAQIKIGDVFRTIGIWAYKIQKNSKKLYICEILEQN